MSFTLSGFFELLLTLLMVYFGVRFILKHHDYLGMGYLYIAATAFLGIFKFGGLHSIDWFHGYFYSMTRLVATPLIGLGILSALWGVPNHKMVGYLIGIITPLVSYWVYIYHLAELDGLGVILGAVLMIALLILAYSSWRSNNSVLVITSLTAFVLFIIIGLLGHTIPSLGIFNPVDFIHIMLMMAYSCIFYGVTKL